jgi:hypothetical protein
MEIYPIEISESQYDNALYCVTSANDVYLLYPSNEYDLGTADAQVWLYQQDGALEELMNEVGEENCGYFEMQLAEEIQDAYYCRVNQRVNQLDLDGLRNGQVIWWNAM